MKITNYFFGLGLCAISLMSCTNKKAMEEAGQQVAGEFVNAIAASDQGNSMSAGQASSPVKRVKPSISFSAGTDEELIFKLDFKTTHNGAIEGSVKVEHDFTIKLTDRTNLYNKTGTYTGTHKFTFSDYSNYSWRVFKSGSASVEVPESPANTFVQVSADPDKIAVGDKVTRTSTNVIYKVKSDDLVISIEENKKKDYKVVVDLEVTVEKRVVEFEIGAWGWLRRPTLKERKVNVTGTVNVDDYEVKVNRSIDSTTTVE